MAIWDDLDNDELYFIMECSKFKHIFIAFQKKIPKDKWLAAARSYYHTESNQNLISHSIFSALNDAPSYSFMTLLSIIGTATLKVFALSIYTAGLAAVTLIAGTVYFIASYRKQRNKASADQKYFDFAAIKIQCAEEIIRRHEQSLQHRNDHNNSNLYTSPEIEADVCKPFRYRNKNKLDKFQPALAAALLTATMTFGTYYLGASVIVAAFGAVAAAAFMTGPIGMGIALGVAVGIGLFCGIRQYQNEVLDEKIQKQQIYMEQYFNFKRYQCYALEKIVHNNTMNNDPSLDQNLLHKKVLENPASKELDFLMRRNAMRNKHTQKQAPADPIIPTPTNTFKM